MKKIFLLITLCCATAVASYAQDMMSINPDARTSAMGDVSAAVTADAWSVYGNAASPLFGLHTAQVQVSYTPWQRSVESGYNLFSLGGYVLLGKRHALSVGGKMYYQSALDKSTSPFNPKDENNQPLEVKVTRPNDKAVDLAYAYRISDKVGLALNVGYLHTSNGLVDGTGNAVSLGLALYSSLPLNSITDGSKLNIGAAVSNFGIPFGDTKLALPMTAKAGASLYVPVTDAHSIEGAVDLGYLYQTADVNNFMANVGLEYSLMQLIKMRVGYMYSNYGCFTAGLGLRFVHVQLDASYWVASANCPWRNTFRVGLGVEF